MQLFASTVLFMGITTVVYYHVGIRNILASYRLWFKDGYWVNYNVVEAVAWLAKAAVILPGLIWQQEIWQLHLITLSTSALLIWVSERKLRWRTKTPPRSTTPGSHTPLPDRYSSKIRRTTAA